MRINIYAEELTDVRPVERVTKYVEETDTTYFGARIYLESASALHDNNLDDDRSAITFWGPRDKIASLLRMAANEMELG